MSTVAAFVAAVLVIVGLVAVPNQWAVPTAQAAGPTSPTSGAFSVTSTVTPSTLPVGGGTVTMTYTVKNLSKQGNRYLFYSSDTNSVCQSTTSTGLVRGQYDDYIVPGGTATFTCTATVRDTTDIKQTFEFYSWDAYNRTGNGNETIQLTDRVTVTPPPASLGTCDTPWFTSFDAPGFVGTVDPVSGASANRWKIDFVTTRQYQERNAAGQLLYWAYDGNTGNYYKTTYNTGSPVVVGSNFSVTGSSGFAIDPTNPQFAYFSGRNGDVFSDELYRIDLLTGTITSLGSSPAFASNRMGVDANGTLWSFANDGILYSVANVNSLKTDKPLDQYATALPSSVVVSHGIPTYFDPVSKTNQNFTTLQSGDIAFDGNGTMYVLAAPASSGAQVNTKLLTIDPVELTKSSGMVAKLVGDMGFPTVGSYFNGLAFDTKGTLYASSTNASTDVSALYTINMATGKPTIKQTSNTGAISWGDLSSCALPTPRLVVTKTAAPSPVPENGIVTYTIQVKNIGTIDATGATFKDLIPAGTSYVAGSTKLNGNGVTDVNGTGAFVGTREIHGTGTSTAGLIPKGDTATVTFQVKVAAGQTQVCNQGEVNFTTLGGAILSDDPSQGGAADKTCVDVLKPSVQVVKLINGNDANTAPGVPVPAGSNMNVTFEVTNTGNAPLIDLAVTDNRVATNSIVCAGSTNNIVKTLAPGRSVTCSATLAAPQPGQTHANTATVSATPSIPGVPAQPPVTDTDGAFAFTPNTPAISISKLINDDPADTAPGVAVSLGQLMNIKFVVTNTGTSPLSNVKVTDDKVNAKDILCPKMTLAPAEQMTCTAAIMAPQAGVQHVDNATVVAKPAANIDGTQPADITATNPAYAYVPVSAAIDLVKKIEGQDINAAPGVIVEPGKPLAVTFEVTNNSNVRLTNVGITDTKAAGISCPKNVLEIGEKMVCTATVPAMQPGENHMNTATVTGTPPANLDGTPATPVTDTDVEYARAKAAPAFELVKKINGDDANLVPGVAVPAGQPMNVTYEVKNTGNLPLVDIAVTDDKITNVSCPATTLAVGGAMTCTATLAAPEPNTQHTNVGTLTVTPQLPDGTKLPPRTATDPANAHVVAVPGIKVVKKINGEDANDAPGVTVAEGSTLNYIFEVTNTGNVPLTSVTVTDDKVAGISCPTSELAAGATTTCTATGVAPDPGVQHTNTATATGLPPALLDGTVPPPVTATDKANALVPAQPSLKIVKKINGEDANEAPGVEVGEGSTMVVSFEITNTGNVTLSGGTLIDDIYGPITCPTNTLAPGYTTTCVSEQKAPAVGTLHKNTGKATATPPPNPDGTPATPVTASDPAFATVVPKLVPSIEVIKKGNGLDANFAPGASVPFGSDINYTFHVINTGNTVLNDVSVKDDKLGAVTCPKSTLAVGEAMDCTPITGKAPAPGEQHTNIAKVTATSPQGVAVDDDDPYNAYVENMPAVSIKKSINGQDANTDPVEVTEGSTMDITFLVTNTGNVPLHNVVVGDNLVKDISCSATTLDVGKDMTCTAKLAAPAPGELHENMGFVTADSPPHIDGHPAETVSAQDPAKAIVPATPSIEVVKKLNGEDANDTPVTLVAGEPMLFTFDVKNTGNVSLTNVVVTDDKLFDISCPKTDLAAGETMQCSASASAPAVGELHTNTATVSGQPPKNVDGSTPPPVKAQDLAKGIIPAKPGLDVTKFINDDDANDAPGVIVAEGSTMSVSVHVVNTGNTPLMNVSVTDPQVSNLTCPKAELAAGEDMYCLGSLPAPKSGVQHTNIATGNAAVKNPDGTAGTTVTDKDSANALGTDAPTPAIEVIKKINDEDANAAPGVHVGEGSTMMVTFLVANVGNTGLRNIAVTDDHISNVVCPATELAAKATMTCTATMTAPGVGTQHENVATATGTEIKADGSDGATVTDTNPAFAVSDPKPVPGVSIIKRINGDDANTAPGVAVPAGATMNITFEVRNTGNTLLTNLQVNDPDIGGVIIRPDYKYTADGRLVPFDGSLAPGEWTSADAPFPGPAAGKTHTDVATVTGDYTAPDGAVTKIEKSDPAHAFAPGTPSLSIKKSINGDDANSAPGVKVDAGSTMNISIEVTNTGDVDLTDVNITDDKIAADAIKCESKTPLKPNETITCTATLPAPAANEQHTNNATATAQAAANPDGSVPEVKPVTDPANAYSGTFSDITIQKLINDDDANTAPGVEVTAGGQMEVKMIVTNTGSVKLSNVTVTDDKIPSDLITCPKKELGSGESMTCTASYPAPMENGMTHEDVASVVGTPPMNLDGTTPPSPQASDPAYAHTPGVAGISVVKKINGDDANVAPGVRVTPGTPLNVEFVVTNTGSVELTEVKVTDDKIAATDITCPQTTLAKGESMTCTATAPALKESQTYDNVATVTGQPPLNPDGSKAVPPTAKDEAHAHTDGASGISIKKMINTDDAQVAPGIEVQPGETMYFTFEVVNTGTTVLTDVKVTDDKITTPITCPVTTLQPGEKTTCKAELAAPTATGAEHDNVATVTADPPKNPDNSTPPPVTSTDEAHAHTPGLAKINIVKFVNGADANTTPGITVDALSQLDFTFIVSNEGQVPLTGVAVSDDKLGTISCPQDKLAIGESMKCTATGYAPREGEHVNKATVVGNPPVKKDGTPATPVTASDEAHATVIPLPAPGTPGIAIIKKINGADADTAPGLILKAGETMAITYEVSNTGTAPLIDVKVTDDKVSAAAIHCPQTNLAAGEAMVCEALLPAPAPGVQHTNVGKVTATGTDAKGAPLPNGMVTATNPANAILPVTPGNPGVMVVKKINGQDAETAPGVAVEPGSTMNITFDVKNFGDVALKGVKVTDDKVSSISCPKDTLAPGETMQCTGTLAAPKVGAQHSNTATVVGTPEPNPGELPQGPVTDTDLGHAYVPAIEVVKKINGDDANTAPGVTVTPGTLMDVTFDVINRGRGALTDIQLTDSVVPGLIGCPKDALAPGETMTCAAKLTAPPAGQQHTNTAKVTAKSPTNADGSPGVTVTDDDPANAIGDNVAPPEPTVPGVKIVKKINGDDANSLPGVSVKEGDQMNVTFEVTNTGGALLTNIKVIDDKIANVKCEQDSLHVGETMVCTGTIAAPKAGESHTNIGKVIADGVDLSGKPVGTVSASDPANATSLPKIGRPSVKILKKINGSDASSAPGVAVPDGQPMQITMDVTNTGDVDLTDVKVTDNAVTGVQCPKNALTVGESMTCTATMAAPKPGMQHTNLATVEGTPKPNTGETPQSPVKHEDNANAYTPGIKVIKKINGDDANDKPVTVPSDAPMFVTFEVTNTGLAALTKVTLTDDVIKAGISCPKTELVPSETMVCTASAPAPAAGVEHRNTATVIGEAPSSPDQPTPLKVTASDIARAVVPAKPAPGTPKVAIVKKINGDDANTAPGVMVQPNTLMDVTFVVTNTGQTKLTNVSVTDDKIAGVSCPRTELLAGESMECAGTAMAPAAGGKHTNTGSVTATGVDQDGAPLGTVTAHDPANAYAPVAPGNPGIVIVKKINDVDAALAPGAAAQTGAMMKVTFDVTNTGDVDLTGVTVTDDHIAGISCPSSSLTAGQSMTCTGIASAPPVGTQHKNSAQVVGIPVPKPDMPPMTPVKAHDEAFAYTPGIKVIKKINGEDADSAPVTVPRGVDMFVTFDVTNPSLVALRDVKVTDNVIASGITCPSTELAPGATMTCYATAKPPADGVTHINVATVTGQAPATMDGTPGATVTDTNPAQAVVAPLPAPGTPAIKVVKKINGDDANTAPGVAVDAESDMAISMEVTNTGQTKLKNVTVTDDHVTSISCPKAELVAGETMVCTATLKGPKAGEQHTDLAKATAVGVDSEGKELQSVVAEDPANAHAAPKQSHPGVVIVKMINGQDASIAPGVAVADGSDMKVTFKVTNTGDVELNDVTVTDDKIANVACPESTLAVGASMECAATLKAPKIGEQHVDVAKVVAKPKPNSGEPDLPKVTDDDNAHAYVPSIKVVKMINGDDANTAPGVSVKPGENMDVTFLVTNTGLGALNKVALTDDHVAATAIVCPKHDLLPGESMTCTAKLPAPADKVQHKNTATVVAQPPANADSSPVPPVTASDVAHARGAITPPPPPGSSPWLPHWWIPLIPVVGGLTNLSSNGSSENPKPALNPHPAPGKPANLPPTEPAPQTQPQAGPITKALAATGVEKFGLVLLLGGIAALIGLAFLIVAKRPKK